LERELPQKPNEVWVGDITYIPLSGGNWCYLSVMMDLFSRRIVGWQLDDNMKEPLVTATLNKAIRSRKIDKGLLIHSDRGGQYGGKIFRALIGKKELLQSMGRADNPYDNAFMESCFSRFKAELLQDGIFETIEDARTEIFEYIEMYYNTQRLHSSLDYQSPNEFEKQFEKSRTFEMHKQGTMLYAEESPLIERGIEPLPIKHKQENSALSKESVLIL
jgi:transposase InsO family protein